MGLQPEPEFKIILNCLKDAKLNENAKDRNDELRLVKKWIKEKK